MSLAENIKRIRESKKLSQNDLAQKVGVTQAMIHYIEAGCKLPNVILGAQIAKELGTTVETLIESG